MRNLIFAFVLSIPTVARAQRDLKSIPDPDPEIERKSFLVADGFEVNLFASEATPSTGDAKGAPFRGIAKPIEMNFDARGRLWVASSEVYPQIQPGQPATDKILVLEDKDGDGRADSTTVFADGLLIPTGVEPGDGGAYVANSTELIHLKDTDGDGRSDARRVMLSGFGTEDTHHIIHTFRWGEDGLLYFNQSIYIHSHIETPHGPRRLNGGGIWQFRPETMGLEVFARGWVNAWGHHEDAWGASFATDGAGGEGINFVVPGAYYTTAPDAVRILPGLNPGSPKYCGLEVVSGRHLPDDWQGNLLTNDFRANRVCRFVVSEDGSGFAAREQQELIRTAHGAFRPIDVKMGPDGAIYIADWYNPIIQHGEVDFRDPRRDHTHGRIWRVTAKGRPLVERPKLDGAPVASLLEALKAPEGYTRHFARRVLKERGAKEVIPALASWVEGLDARDSAYEHHRLEALWTYQALDVPAPRLLTSVLNSPEPRARAAASRVVPHWQGRLSDARTLLVPRAIDGHPRVRLEAVRALGKLDDARVIEPVIRALDQPRDRWLDYALWLTCRETRSRWLPALQAGGVDFGGDPKKLEFLLSAAGSPAVVGPLLDSLEAGKIAVKDQASALALASALGSPTDLGRLLGLAVSSDAGRAARLDALTAAASTRKVVPPSDRARIAPFLVDPEAAVRLAAIRLASAWGDEAFADRLIASASAAETPPAERSAAIQGLSRMRGPGASRAILELSSGRGPRPARGPAIVALATRNPEAGAEAAVAFLGTSQELEILFEMISGLLGRKGGAARLASALKDASIPIDSAKAAIRAVRASGREEPLLVEALIQSGGIGSRPAALTDAEMKQAVADVLAQGDPARGEAIFRRKEMQCLNCHAIAGAGGQIGPGLESIGASAPMDYLIDSLLRPSKAVKEGYHTLTVAADDGRVVTGIRLRDDDRGIVLRDADGREVSIPASSVEEKKDAGSLMPSGLTETLTRGELLDLVRFLSELGKVGPYSVSKARLVRTWSLAPGDVAPGRSETPAYSRVDGILPLDAMGDASRVSFRVEVTTSGTVRLHLNSGEGVRAILADGRPQKAAEVVDVDLAPGVHTIALDLDRVARKDGLRVEIEDAPGSPAKAQPVVGK